MNLRTRQISIVLLLLLNLFFQQSIAGESAPEKMIKQAADELLTDITMRKKEFLNDSSALFKLVEERAISRFDFERMTNLALGRYQRKVTSQQKQQLTGAFKSMLVRTYGKALLEYNDQKIIYLPMRGSVEKGEVTVRTEIEQQGGFPIPIDYEIYLVQGAWKVYDIIIDNISLVTNYRSSFAREIKQKGVASLIKTLQSRNKEEG